MKRMTRNIGISEFRPDIGSEKVEIKNILICRPNHRLGNLILITPLVQEVIATFPRAKIDLLVKGTVAPFIFKNYTNINRIIQLPKKPLKHLLKYLKGWMTIKNSRYDVVVNVVNHSSSGRISAQFANAKYRFFGDITPGIKSKYTDHEHMAKYPVYSFRSYLGKLGMEATEEPVPSLNLKLSELELNEGKRLLKELVGDNTRTISLFTFATGAKCYPVVWWEELYNQLKSVFPHDNIIEILPVENVSQIAFKAPAFYSRDIREIASVIANTALFIGADSGMMHLASSSHTTTMGLFKAENMITYAPYGGRSLGFSTVNNSIADCVRIVKGILQPANAQKAE